MKYFKQLTTCTSIYISLLFTIVGNASSIKIRPESCTNAMGDKGTCMFVWQCIKQDGVQLGPCVDRFLVGTCCSLPKEEDNLVPGSSGSSNGNTTSAPFSPSKGDLPNKLKPAASNVQSTVVVGPPVTTPAPLIVSSSAPVKHDLPLTTEKPFVQPTSAPLPKVTTKATSTTAKPAKPSFVEQTECGIPGLFPKSKVVGGTHSSFGQWPWQVSIRRSSFFGFASTHRCGGAILNANWVITAAHCVDDLIKSQIRIRVGEFDFSTVQEPAPFQERGIEKKVVHPRYNFFTYEHDLALVKLDVPLNLQNHVKPICLPNKDESFVGYNATVTGWGRLSEGGTLPSKLQQVQVPIISNEKCQQMFNTAGRQESIPEIFLCAGYETGGRDSCQGDSGGPLQARREDGRWFLAGIISWGIGCAEPNMPGVCTRISKFTGWVNQVIS